MHSNYFVKSILSVFLIITIWPESACGQTPKKRLPVGINIPTTSQVYPSVTGDGMYMVFMSNYSNSGFFELMSSNKIGGENWERGEHLPNINKTDLDLLGSYTISYDGQYLFFSSQRSQGVGKFDIWYSERKGANWSPPVNMGKPVNSIGQEGNPCLSADGRSLYFMRCESMDRTTKDNCKIYVSTKQSPTRWGEPTALPSPVNVGHETTPRILVDGKTLIFSSNRAGGKGGMDLYQTRLEYGKWTKPIPLDFINSTNNEEFISVPARGDIMYYHDKYKEHFQLYKAIIPMEFRSENVMMMTGKVQFIDAPPLDALVQAIDVKSNKTISSTRINSSDGSFFMVLPEGSKYDLSVFPLQPGFEYHAQILDLDSIGRSTWEKPEYEIHKINPGSAFVLNALFFDEETVEIAEESSIEMRRLSKFMKQNAGKHFEISAYIDTLRTDTIPSSDLTEIVSDTSFVVLDKNALKEKEKEYEDDKELDELNAYLEQGFQIFEEDRKEITLMSIKNTYHNDRSAKMAQAIVVYLTNKGAPESMFTSIGYADQWTQNHATEDKSYWIEIRATD